MKQLWHLIILLLTLGACGGSSSDCGNDLDLSNIRAEAKIIHLEDEIFALQDPTQVGKFLDKYPDFARAFYGRGRVRDSVIADAILRMVNTPEIRGKVREQCKKAFTEMKDIEDQFAQAFRRIKYFYPDFKEPKIYTTLTGLAAFLGTDIAVSREAIVISLEFFLPKSKDMYRPPVEMMPDYIWRRYRRETIVPTALQYLSNAYNKTDLLDKTLLAEMIYYGKAYHFVKTMSPCSPDSLVMGYTSTEMANITEEGNRRYIWNHFVEKKLLYNKTQMTKNAYLNERPYVAEINAKCPGRIGQWLGWQIMRRYANTRPDKEGFRALMSNPNAQQIFQQSGFKGE